MLISKLITILQTKLNEHGGVEVHAFPGYDTSYPVTKDSIEYYSSEVTGSKPHILITSYPESSERK